MNSESIAGRSIGPKLLLLRLFLLLGCMWSSAATAQEVMGPFAFVEWNPAAIKDDTVSLSGEYLVIDGVAFGTAVKVSDKKSDGYQLTSVNVGALATQYFFESTLKGFFLRGEVGFFGDRFRAVVEEDGSQVEESGFVFGASLGGLAGYRFLLTEHLTGSAGYGVTRNIPDFFKRSSSLNASYIGDKGDWRFEVLAGLGVSF